MDACSPPSRDFPKKSVCSMSTSLPRCAVFLITCVRRPKSLHDRLLTEPVARRYVRARCVGLGRARTTGWIFFLMNNRSSSLQRGSAGEETSVWHQGDGENEGAFKGGRRRKGRIFFGVGLWCFGKVQRRGPLDQ